MQESFDKNGIEIKHKIATHNTKPSTVNNNKGSFQSSNSNQIDEVRNNLRKNKTKGANSIESQNKESNKLIIKLKSTCDVIKYWRDKYSFIDHKLLSYY